MPTAKTSKEKYTFPSNKFEDFHTTRTIKDGFTQAEEWWQTEIRHRTRWFKLDVIHYGCVSQIVSLHGQRQ
jgi:hypothetical protein